MENEWTEEEEVRAQKFAQAVVDRRMALPTVLLLESLRPLHFVGGQFLHFMAPISGLIISRWDLDQLGSFLEHRGAVPFVIDEIQRLDNAREQKRRDQKRSDATGTVTDEANQRRQEKPQVAKRHQRPVDDI